MNKLLLLAVLAGICIPIVVSNSVASKPSRPGSFTACSVDTVAEVVKQITSNPVVADRYASHFHIPRARLVRYLQDNLKVVTLDKPMTGETYFVNKKGKIFSKVRTFPKGTKMFVAPNGEAILDPRCGNPMVKFPSPKPTIVVENPVITQPVQVKTAGSLEVYSNTLAPVLTPVPVETVVQPSVVPVAAAVPAAPRVSSPKLAYAAPLLLGAIAVHRSNEVVIPEPATVMSVCGVLMPAALVFRRRKGRKAAAKTEM